MAPIGGVRAGYLSARKDAIPDSGILNLVGADYDGTSNVWTASTGPDVPDVSGDPTKVSGTLPAGTFDVVNYDGSDDASKTTNISVTETKQAVIYTGRWASLTGAYMLDGGSGNEFAHLNSASAERIFSSAGTDAPGGSADTNWHTFAIEGDNDGSNFELYKDTASSALLTGSGYVDLSGITIGAKGNVSAFENIKMAELTVLEGHTTQEFVDEFDRQRTKYGT